ncbi:MAG: hypothetical protein E7181_03265 [Erysipelotrichaceae bacterium]|nr:hypothetical protein [Erysipelotrichaceae bacterium]
MDKEVFNKYLYDYIHLLSSYLNNEKLDDMDIDDKQLSFYIKFSKFHSLSALLYKAIVDTGIKINKEYLPRLEEAYLSNVRKTVLFDKERNELYKYLNDNKIDYLPLKGIIIKDYYPDPATREFADNDILFDDSKKELVKRFFADRGYKVKSYDVDKDDVYLKDPFYNFEMHRYLFEHIKEFELLVPYYEGLLERSPIKSDHEHYLSNEDFYIYYIAHLHKHYQNAGCGLRNLIDCYVFIKNNKLNIDYIDKELEKLELLEFSKEINSLSIKLFSNKELDDNEKDILLYIASSSTYGTLGNKVEKGVKNKGRLKYIFSRIFPPVTEYKILYPWAYKHHILIPIAWTFRLFRGLFKQHDKTRNELKEINKHK